MFDSAKVGQQIQQAIHIMVRDLAQALVEHCCNSEGTPTKPLASMPKAKKVNPCNPQSRHTYTAGELAAWMKKYLAQKANRGGATMPELKAALRVANVQTDTIQIKNTLHRNLVNRGLVRRNTVTKQYQVVL